MGYSWEKEWFERKQYEERERLWKEICDPTYVDPLYEIAKYGDDLQKLETSYPKLQDMFARAVLKIEDPLQLCPLLQTLDIEETEKQNEERGEIEHKKPYFKVLLSVAHGMLGVTGMGLVELVVNDLFPLTLPFSGPIGIVAGLVAGIAVGILSYKTNNFGSLESSTEKRLGVQCAERLKDKVKRIIEEKAVEGKTTQELDQLNRVEREFRKRINKIERAKRALGKTITKNPDYIDANPQRKRRRRRLTAKRHSKV